MRMQIHDFQNKHPTCRVYGFTTPEIKQKIFTSKCDIFSCGVLTRKDLFDHESNTYDEKMMLDQQYQNLLRMMLQFNSELRTTADQCREIINQLSKRTPSFSNILDKSHIDIVNFLIFNQFSLFSILFYQYYQHKQ